MKILQVLLAAALAGAVLTAPVSAQEIQVAGGETYVQTATGMRFPAQVGDWVRGRLYRYAADGSDESAGYHLGRPGAEITATVYVYPSPPLDIEPGSDPAAVVLTQALLCGNQFAGVRREIEASYQDETLISDGAADPPQPGAAPVGYSAVYTFTAGAFWGRRDVPVRSEAHLFCYVGGRWSVKYRISYPAEADASAEVAAFMRNLVWTIGAQAP